MDTAPRPPEAAGGHRPRRRGRGRAAHGRVGGLLRERPAQRDLRAGAGSRRIQDHPDAEHRSPRDLLPEGPLQRGRRRPRLQRGARLAPGRPRGRHPGADDDRAGQRQAQEETARLAAGPRLVQGREQRRDRRHAADRRAARPAHARRSRRRVRDSVLAGAPEFKTRHQGVVGLREVYAAAFKDYQPVRPEDHAMLAEQLVKGTMQAARLFTTDPAIRTHDLWC